MELQNGSPLVSLSCSRFFSFGDFLCLSVFIQVTLCGSPDIATACLEKNTESGFIGFELVLRSDQLFDHFLELLELALVTSEGDDS